MQPYFDRLDAELEFETLVTRSHSKADPSTDETPRRSSVRRILDILGLGIVMSIAGMLLAAHLGSAMPSPYEFKSKKKPAETRFVIEIPPKEKEKPKPKPKVEPPKPKVTERLRSVPDSRMTDRREPIVEEKRREEVVDHDRDIKSDKAQKRSLPAVRTPVIETKIESREAASNDAIRYSALEHEADTIGGIMVADASGPARALPEEEDLSRIKLDPYHYQMVNICLRLCVKTMFTHTGMNETERQTSSKWLKVVRGSEEYFSFRHRGGWVRFNVNASELSEIANLNFVEIPYSAASDGTVNELLESVTRDLCRILGYDDCFEQL